MHNSITAMLGEVARQGNETGTRRKRGRRTRQTDCSLLPPPSPPGRWRSFVQCGWVRSCEVPFHLSLPPFSCSSFYPPLFSRRRRRRRRWRLQRRRRRPQPRARAKRRPISCGGVGTPISPTCVIKINTGRKTHAPNIKSKQFLYSCKIIAVSFL